MFKPLAHALSLSLLAFLCCVSVRQSGARDYIHSLYSLLLLAIFMWMNERNSYADYNIYFH